MDQKTTHRILDIQEQIRRDENSRELLEEYESQGQRFLALMQTLTQNQQDVIYDYLGVCIAMHLKMLELAVQ